MKPRAAALSVILAFALLRAPPPSYEQQPAKLSWIGWLSIAPPDAAYTSDASLHKWAWAEILGPWGPSPR